MENIGPALLLQRSLSNRGSGGKYNANNDPKIGRRKSHDVLSQASAFLIQVDNVKAALVQREDTDGDTKLTVDDHGPKTFPLGTATSDGFRQRDIRGTYRLANLLREVAMAQERGQKLMVLDHHLLDKNPVDRLRGLIRDRFWSRLERRLDESVIDRIFADPKDYTSANRARIYVPPTARDQYDYYVRVAQERPEFNLEVVLLPEKLTYDLYRDMNSKPGILALAMEEDTGTHNGQTVLRGLPFIVPGGCFNELYNWDSYFIALGLLIDKKVDLVKALVENFVFEIQHYGMIPNANRSYYLYRSQPPFLTDLALRTYKHINDKVEAKKFLHRAISAAIKEYYKIWAASPRHDPGTGLSRYRPDGVASPPECDTVHFENILRPFAEKHSMSIVDFRRVYDAGQVSEPDLDEYFLHDRGVRESGHDVSLRVEGVCGDLATIDLNCLLYKYETDIASTIRNVFGDAMELPSEFCLPGQGGNRIEQSSAWDRKARTRKQAIDKYLWSDVKGTYLDYNTKKRTQTEIESATCFWALWCGVASPRQAAMLVAKALPRFEQVGGLCSTLLDGRNQAICHAAHQWDYPYGWAPHQVMAWDGLLRYGYTEEAERLIYRWLYLITRTFADYSGTVVEKYDVTTLTEPHKVNIEYGNQGNVFQYYSHEGFGWTNASYVYGLTLLNTRATRALGVLTPWTDFAASLNKEPHPSKM